MIYLLFLLLMVLMSLYGMMSTYKRAMYEWAILGGFTFGANLVFLIVEMTNHYKP